MSETKFHIRTEPQTKLLHKFLDTKIDNKLEIGSTQLQSVLTNIYSHYFILHPTIYSDTSIDISTVYRLFCLSTKRIQEELFQMP
jgi:hypothetical protein